MVPLLMIFAVLFYRKYIGITTFINLFLLGYLIDFSEQAIFALMGTPDLVARIIYLAAGIVILCFASSLYIVADLGVSTYDAVALFLAEKKIAPFRLIRICTDLLCVGIGWALGYVPGVGTVITALFMGPLLDYFNRKVAIPFLERE